MSTMASICPEAVRIVLVGYTLSTNEKTQQCVVVLVRVFRQWRW